MDKEKMITRHYLETGILGAYETAEVDWVEEKDGRYTPCFDDVTVLWDKEQTSTTRMMDIEGRRFRIRSFFPTDTGITPTDKLLTLIDTELEKETQSA